MTQKKTATPRKATFVKQPPHLAVELEEADIGAIKAVNRGDATPENQRRAMDCIMKKICLIGGVVFSDKGNEITNFMAGRRMPALILANIIQSNTANSHTFNTPN